MDFDRWNPMADAYNDKKFNSYNSGVGRDLLDSIGDRAAGARLYVRDVPTKLGQDGFKNMFAEYGTVVEHKLIESDKETTIGFVTMATVVEGERAISRLHQKKLGKTTMKVCVAFTPEEKERRKHEKQRDEALMGSLKKEFDFDDTASIASDISHVSRREGSHRKDPRALGNQRRDINIDRQEWHALAQRQGHPGPYPTINIGRGIGRHAFEPPNMRFPLPFGRGRPGPMHPMMPGQGFNIMNSSFNRMPGPMHPIMPGPAFNMTNRPFLRKSGPMNSLLPHPAFNMPGQPFNMPGPAFNNMNTPFEWKLEHVLTAPDNARLKGKKFCTFCRKEGCTNFCSRCMLYYCSVACQKKDWPDHKQMCLVLGDYYSEQEAVTSHEDNETSDGQKNHTDFPNQKKIPQQNGNGPHQKKATSAAQENEFPSKKVSTHEKGGGVSNPKASYKQKKGSALDSRSPVKGKGHKMNEKGDGQKANRKDRKSQDPDQMKQTEKEEHNSHMASAGSSTYGQVQMDVPVGSSGSAYLTYYEKPSMFWICLMEHLEEFTQMTDLLLKQASHNPPKSVKPRDTFGVMWEGEWARIEVISVEGDNVKVFFMDYGNTADVKVKDLRPLTLDIIKLPAQALCCCISRVKSKGSGSWSKVASQAVEQWFGAPGSKSFSFEVVSKRGSKHAVKMSADNEALSEFLLSSNLGERTTDEPGLPSLTGVQSERTATRFTMKNMKREMDMINVGEQLTTLLLDCQSLKRLVVMKQSTVTTQAELEALMEAEFSVDQPCYTPEVGEVVAAIYSADNKWYRSNVLDVKGQKCSLEFIDYGNQEDQITQNVREIKNKNIKDIPAQALICSLYGLDTLLKKTSEDDLMKHFAALLPSFQLDRTLTLVSVKEKTEHQLCIDIVSTKGLSLSKSIKDAVADVEDDAGLSYSNEDMPLKADLGKSLKGISKASSSSGASVSSQQLPKRTPVVLEKQRLPKGRSVFATIAHVNDCGEFFVCLKENELQFRSFETKLNTSINEAPFLTEAPDVGDLVAVKFSVDQVWYRGQVIQIKPGSSICKIIFVDFGNIESVAWQKLRELDMTFCKLPSQAVKSHLRGNLKSLSAESHSQFKQYLENATVEVKCIEECEDSAALHISANGTDINACLFGEEKPEPAKTVRKITDPILEIGNPIKVECVNMTSPAAFYVQISSQAMECMETMLNIKARLDKIAQPVKSVAAGDFVASKFSQDDDVIWYRGKVEKVQGNRAKIYYVDYGNSEEQYVSSLMELSEEDFVSPACTVRCQLKSCKNPSPELVAKFANSGPAQIDSIRVLSQGDQGCIVDILDCDGNCITELYTKAPKSPMAAQMVNQRSHTSPAESKSEVQVSPKPTASRSLAFEEEPLPIQSISDRSEPVIVSITHIDSLSNFFCQCVDENLQGQLLQLMVTLNQSAESLPPLSGPKIGALCAACFSQDGSWYRGRVTSITSSSSCIVQFIDYGNCEETEMKGVKKLKGDEFLKLPAQAIKCCLSGFEDELEEEDVKKPYGSSIVNAEELKSDLLDKPVNLMVMKQLEHTKVVDMEVEEIHSIAAKYKLLKQRFQASPDQSKSNAKLSPKPAASPALVKEKFLPTQVISDKSQSVTVSVSHVDSCSTIYCQWLDESLQNQLLQLMMALNQAAESLPPLSEPKIGTLCAACFSQDASWYRGRVTSLKSSSSCIVQFIDYGNCEETQMSGLKELKGDELLKLPAQAIKCCLLGFEDELEAENASKLGGSNTAIVEQLKADLIDKPVNIMVVKQNEDTTLVDMEIDQIQSLSNKFKLLKQCHTSPAESKSKSQVSPKPTGSLSQEIQMDTLSTQSISDKSEPVLVSITHIDSLSSFFCQCVDENLQGQLLQLMVTLNQSAESLPPLSSPKIGALCAACFSQDGSWYRGRVTSITSSSSCIVQFIDYGNCEETEMKGLKELKGDELFNLPAQAITCCLLGYENDLQVETAAKPDGSSIVNEEQFKSDLIDKPVNMTVVKQIEETKVVDMEVEQIESIAAKYKRQARIDENIPMLSEVTFEQPKEKEFSALFVSLTDFDEFYCQPCNKDDLDELMAMGELLKGDMDELADNVACKPVLHGIYTSMYQGDWYRCVIEKISGSVAKIKYIDYGNVEEKAVSDLRPLKRKRLALPVRLLKCKLHGVEPAHQNWDPEATAEYINILNKSQPQVTIHGEGVEGHLLVSLKIENGMRSVDVAEDLVSIGMATMSEDTTEVSPKASKEAEAADDEKDALDKQIEELQNQMKMLMEQRKRKAKN